MRAYLLTTGCVLALLAGTGCRSTCHDCERRQSFGPQPPPMALSSNMLFTPNAQVAPDSFAYRSDWPSTPTYYDGGQIIFYREQFNDYQGRTNNPNATFRQFQTFRSGYWVR